MADIAKYVVGAKVRTLVDQIDDDEKGRERITLAGAEGEVTFVDFGGRVHVGFTNGAWLIFDPRIPSGMDCVELVGG